MVTIPISLNPIPFGPSPWPWFTSVEKSISHLLESGLAESLLRHPHPVDWNIDVITHQHKSKVQSSSYRGTVRVSVKRVSRGVTTGQLCGCSHINEGLPHSKGSQSVIDGIRWHYRWVASDGLVSVLYHRLVVLLKLVSVPHKASSANLSWAIYSVTMSRR